MEAEDEKNKQEGKCAWVDIVMSTVSLKKISQHVSREWKSLLHSELLDVGALSNALYS